MTWQVGQRVRSVPSIAHIWEGTPWKRKLSKIREGTIIVVPKAIETSEDGHCTLRVAWDRLKGESTDPADWLMWVHSSNVEAVQ